MVARVGKYRKRPVEVEAIRLNWNNWGAICSFVPKPHFVRGVFLNDQTKKVLPEGQTSSTMGLIIQLHGQEVVAQEGDWIIKGVEGEYYPCADSTFQKTYESV